jgi:photosystem II stability/assembly factor-like uncharacterized protein
MFSGCGGKDNGDDPDNPGGNGSGLSAWASVTSPISTPFYCIAFGNGKFVAGSDQSTVVISSDNGKTWTTKKVVATNHRINSIIYANNRFVAAGSGGKVFHATNPDGDWTMVDLEPTFDNGIIRTVYFDGTRYVTGGTDGEMAYSTNLVNWTTTKINLFASEYHTVYGYAFGKGQLVAVGASGKVAYASSPDGEWTYIPNHGLGSAFFFQDIIFVNNTFVAVGGSNRIYTDNPSSTWTKVSDNITAAYQTIAFGGGVYVAGSTMGVIAYATKLDSWTKVADSKFGSNAINGIAFGNNTFIAVGGGTNISTIAYATVK